MLTEIIMLHYKVEWSGKKDNAREATDELSCWLSRDCTIQSGENHRQVSKPLSTRFATDFILASTLRTLTWGRKDNSTRKYVGRNLTFSWKDLGQSCRKQHHQCSPHSDRSWNFSLGARIDEMGTTIYWVEALYNTFLRLASLPLLPHTSDSGAPSGQEGNYQYQLAHSSLRKLEGAIDIKRH